MRTRKTYDLQEIVFDFLSEWEEPFLSGEEVDSHFANFMDNVYDRTRLGSSYGYTPQEALRSQLLEYCREQFGYDDPREGA
jgi:hypothetical protein